MALIERVWRVPDSRGRNRCCVLAWRCGSLWHYGTARCLCVTACVRLLLHGCMRPIFFMGVGLKLRVCSSVRLLFILRVRGSPVLQCLCRTAGCAIIEGCGLISRLVITGSPSHIHRIVELCVYVCLCVCHSCILRLCVCMRGMCFL